MMSAAPHQATGVAIAGRGVLIEGAPGSGKSSLALMLIDRGAVLIGDDGVLLDQRGDALWARPHPATAAMLEVRNVGLLRYPCSPARIALVIALDEAAPRFIEGPEQTRREGTTLPLIRLWPHAAALALRAEAALRVHGAPF